VPITSSTGVIASKAWSWNRSMRSVWSRRSAASTLRVMWNRDEPTSFGPVAPAEGRLRRDQRLVPPALERLSEDLLGDALRVHVGRVEHREPRVEADVDEPRGLGDVGGAEALEHLRGAAERARAEREQRDLQARPAELTVFHACDLLAGGL
jgi:hypothetical protein